MKKSLISALIILITLIIGILIFNSLSTLSVYNKYTARNILEKNINYDMNEKIMPDDVQLTSGNLNIKLLDYDYFPNGFETFNHKNALSTTFDFSTNDNIDLISVDYDYIIYDENNNILSTSLFYENGNNEENKYIKCFSKDKYNTFSSSTFSNHFIFGQKQFKNPEIEISEKHIGQSIISSLNEPYSNPSKVIITLLNVKYKTIDSEYKNIENTDFNFILNFK